MVSLHPQNSLAVSLIGLVLALTGAGELTLAARAAQAPAAQLPAEGGDPRLREAHIAVSEADYPRAIALYSTLLQGEKVEPAFLATVYRERGLAQQLSNNPNGAIADYTNAIWLNASPPELQAKAYVGRGLAYLSLSQLAQAVREFDAAVTLAPKLSEAYFGRGTAKRLSGALEPALIDYTKALELGSPTPDLVHYGRGLAYEALGNVQSASTDYRDAVACNPSFVPPLERLSALTNAPKDGSGARPNPAAAEAKVATTVARQGKTSGSSAAVAPPNQVAQSVSLPPQATAPPVAVASTQPPARSDQDTADEPTGSISPPVANRAPTQLPGPSSPAAALRPSSDGLLGAKNEPQPPAAAPSEASASIAAPAASAPAAPASPPTAKVAAAAPVAPARAAASHAPVAPAPSTPAVVTGGGYYVQLASYGSRGPAETAKTALMSKLGNAGKGMSIAAADLGSKGTYYRLRLGPYGERSAAGEACAELRQRGQSCVVVTVK